MITALIPTRSGSKRVKNKNIRLLGGQPLFAWSIQAAKATPEIDRVVVSTDSEYYAEIAQMFGADVLIRPAELAGDDIPDKPVLSHFLDNYKETEKIIFLRPTTPFRNINLISKAIKIFDHRHWESLRSFEETPESAYKYYLLIPSPMLETHEDFPDDFELSQLIHEYEEDGMGVSPNLPNHFYPKTYKPNGYIDILLPSHCQGDYGSIYGLDSYTKPFITPPTIEIDTEHDFELAEMLLERRK